MIYKILHVGNISERVIKLSLMKHVFNSENVSDKCNLKLKQILRKLKIDLEIRNGIKC